MSPRTRSTNPYSVWMLTLEASVTSVILMTTPLSAIGCDCWAARFFAPACALFLLLPRPCCASGCVDAVQPVVPLTSSSLLKRQPPICVTRPDDTSTFPFHGVGYSSFNPNRIRKPTSSARAPETQAATTAAKQRVRERRLRLLQRELPKWPRDMIGL